MTDGPEGRETLAPPIEGRAPVALANQGIVPAEVETVAVESIKGLSTEVLQKMGLDVSDASGPAEIDYGNKNIELPHIEDPTESILTSTIHFPAITGGDGKDNLRITVYPGGRISVNLKIDVIAAKNPGHPGHDEFGNTLSKGMSPKVIARQSLVLADGNIESANLGEHDLEYMLERLKAFEDQKASISFNHPPNSARPSKPIEA